MTLILSFLRARPMRIWLAAAALLLLAIAYGPVDAQFSNSRALGTVVRTDQVRAELMAQAPQGVQAGQPLWVGLQLAHIPHWHTYWKNPGDSGLPTVLEWTLPEGITAGDIAWPQPKKIPIGNLANYGYEGTVLLPVPLTVTSAFKPPVLAGSIDIKLRASWLVCEKECIPQEGEFKLALPVRGSTALNRSAFQAALDANPAPLPESADNQATIEPRTITLRIQGLPEQVRGKALGFYPETPEIIETAAAWTQRWEGPVWTARVPLSAQRSASPRLMPVVLATGDRSWRAVARVQGSWPVVRAAAARAPAILTGLPSADSEPPLTLWAAIAGALLGGLILNLMPCVFPVLAIKVLGFARHGGDRRARRLAGLAYTTGVLASLLALGGLLLALRGAGESLGWGFQLQNPAVVAVLAGLFTLIGLNLSGLFEFGHVLPSSVAGAQVRHPVADAFVTGMLAVAIASPCTAPFMGASLGFAVQMPPAEALAVFAALGLGFALPYLAASFVPAVARALPRPGAWMDTFRRFMAFPMFATVAWLVWVLGQQSGIDGAGALLALLVVLALLIWAFTLAGRTRLLIGATALVAFAVLAWGLGPYVTRSVDVAAGPAVDGTAWNRWEPGRVEQLVAEGRPVFVDFTAAWCVTCQYNKKTTLVDRDVLADVQARNVALLRADWTRRDPAITEALRQLGRTGVPVYVLYQGGRVPIVLSEILSVREVRDALARL